MQKHSKKRHLSRKVIWYEKELMAGYTESGHSGMFL